MSESNPKRIVPNPGALEKTMQSLFGESVFHPYEEPKASTSTSGEVHMLAIDMYETDDALVIETDAPGVDPDKLDIAIQDNIVTLKTEINPRFAKKDDVSYHIRERRHVSTKRAVTLPIEIIADDAEATFENGLLTLTLPKAKKSKAKKISVKVNK